MRALALVDLAVRWLRRKTGGDRKMAAADDDLGIPTKTGRAAAPRPAAPILPPRTAPYAPRPNNPAPPAQPPRPNEASAHRSGIEVRKLIIGREIALSGEITSCDTLIVEGSVEVNLAGCRYVEIAETGLFNGSASIDEAEIRGRFEGTLTCSKRLSIKGTGRVSGTIRYGEIEIERGGQILGDVQAQSSSNGEVGQTRLAPAAD
jgi:cytoskeletal protein CcmA (bactofilin family)